MLASIFIQAFSVFLAAFFLHSVVWKLVKVKKEILTLILIFFVFPSLLFCGALISGKWNLTEFLAGSALAFLLSLAYLQTYPALKNEIPTFQIIFLINRAGRGGIDEDGIFKDLDRQKDLYFDKIEELEQDGLLTRRRGQCVPSRAGRFIARVFILYRGFLGLEAGKG